MAITDADAEMGPISDMPSLSSRVHDKLESLIIARALPPGHRLVEVELAQSLGVSRGPVRVALQHLAQDGFVELRPRQGAFVRVPTTREIDDFYHVRSILESEAARLAATRITPDGAAELRKCLKLARKFLVKDEDPGNQDIPDFHRIIASIADNSELTRYLTLQGKRSIWYKSPFEPVRRKEAWDEHADIVEAIARGDANAAASAMRAHIDGARARYTSLYRLASGA